MKKGFTLIELLAVIVILAIILLISMPIVINVISEARKGAFEATARGLIKTVENEYMKNALSGDTSAKVYTFEDYVQTGGDPLEFSGKAPRNGYIYVHNDGKIGAVVEDGDWLVKKEMNGSDITSEELVDQDLGDEIAGIVAGEEVTLIDPVSCPNDYMINDPIMLLYFTNAVTIIESYLIANPSSPGEFMLPEEDEAALEIALNNLTGLVGDFVDGEWMLNEHGMTGMIFQISFSFDNPDTHEYEEYEYIWAYTVATKSVSCMGMIVIP